MKIDSIKALEIFDSRGNPTIKAYVVLENGIIGAASIPSGASTGSHEAYELRDKNNPRLNGMGVKQCVSKIENNINKALSGKSIEELKDIDNLLIELDGTQNKRRFGANTLLAVSSAAIRALALYTKKPLWKTINEYYFQGIKPCIPKMMSNIINGGKHASWNFPIQEFMIIPLKKTFSKNIEIVAEIFMNLKEFFRKNKLSTLVGDEGGFSPTLDSNEEAFEIIISSAKDAGYINTLDYEIGIDVAANELFQKGVYFFKKQNKIYTSNKLADYYKKLIEKFKIALIEDPFAEDDWNSFIKFNKSVEKNCLIVGDDLYTTNKARIQKGIRNKATSAVLIKPNQIGTIIETVEAILITKKAGLKCIVSHRSGETEDSFIADLSVACAADLIKAGSVSRSERLAKYNRLLEIEKMELIQEKN